jgi:hypothetical protein
VTALKESFKFLTQTAIFSDFIVLLDCVFARSALLASSFSTHTK